MLVLVVKDVTRVLAPLIVVVETGKGNVKKVLLVVVERTIVAVYRCVH